MRLLILSLLALAAPAAAASRDVPLYGDTVNSVAAPDSPASIDRAIRNVCGTYQPADLNARQVVLECRAETRERLTSTPAAIQVDAAPGRRAVVDRPIMRQRKPAVAPLAKWDDIMPCEITFPCVTAISGG